MSPEQSEHPLTPEEHLNAQRKRLYDMQNAIMGAHFQWERGHWQPEQDEKLWKDLLGEEAPVFPWESVPDQSALREGCLRHQDKHQGEPIELPLPVFPFSDENQHTIENETIQIQSKINYLQHITRLIADRKGQGLCWEGIAELFHARNITLGNDKGELLRPSLHACLQHCNRYATALYAACTRREQELKEVAAADRQRQELPLAPVPQVPSLASESPIVSSPQEEPLPVAG